MTEVVAVSDELDNQNIEVIKKREHTKASEVYLDVLFTYPSHNFTWAGSVPVYYRRTGFFEETPDGMANVVEQAYNAMHPDNKEEWVQEQKSFWEDFNGSVTDKFFYELLDCQWTCQGHDLPDNPNWARRVQAIKEKGYTIATDRRECDICKEKKTHLLLVRFPRGGPAGYETIPPELRNRILTLLDHYDVYEDRVRRQGLLPDHKFPEIRWNDAVVDENLENMTDGELQEKFQLLDNQRNQQKREACRQCFQSGTRGTPFGIEFYYEGDTEWPEDVPETGPEAELGCVGCGWYDMKRWREELNNTLTSYEDRRDGDTEN